MASPSFVELPHSFLIDVAPQLIKHHNHTMTSNWTRGRQFNVLSDAEYTIIGCTLSITWSFGSFLNGLCLLTFSRNRRIRSPTNIFIMALNLCDFLMCFIGTPLAMSSAWSHRWIWGDAVCDVEAFTVYFLGLSSMYILMAIAVDRYIAISKPVLGKRISMNIALVSCGSCYFAGFLWAIFPAFGWNEFGLEGSGISCSVVWDTNDPVYISYIWMIFMFCLVIPLAVMLYSYWGVLDTLRGLNRNSVWDMNSRIAKRNLAIQKKMLKTAVLIVLSYLCCWMPYTVVSFTSFFFGSHLIHPIFATIPPVIAKCQGLFDPIIYVATNNQMRMAMFELMPCDNIKRYLIMKKEEVVNEQASEETEVETGSFKNIVKKSGGRRDKMKVDGIQTRRTAGKYQQVDPLKQTVIEETIEEDGETGVCSVYVTCTQNSKDMYNRADDESTL